MMFSIELQYQDLKSKSANFMWVQNIKPFGKHFTSQFQGSFSNQANVIAFCFKIENVEVLQKSKLQVLNVAFLTV